MHTTNSDSKPPKRTFFGRHIHIKHFLVGTLTVLVGLVLILGGIAVLSHHKTEQHQDKLAPFYNTSDYIPGAGPNGQVLRIEPLGVNVPNGSGFRIIYRTEKADGTKTFASGMVFVPNNGNAGYPRPVVAWAHGTVGMGDQCAPSRTTNPVSNISWVGDMLAKGWVVTATDYAGLGTPGTEAYLVGGDESNDVINSVRALKYVPQAEAGNNYVIYGHSQGGHSALFAGAAAATYAPDLHLLGTVAAAPAAELIPLLQEGGGELDWVIGPEILVSWPASYPNLNPQTITTDVGYKNYKKIANQCIGPAVIGGLARTKLNQVFFKKDPATDPAWRSVATAQTAPALPSSQPLLIAESLTDAVVKPNTTALYIQSSCKKGSNLTSIWVNNVSHQDIPKVIAPQVETWIANRFAGQPAISGCAQPLPIAPANSQ